MPKQSSRTLLALATLSATLLSQPPTATAGDFFAISDWDPFFVDALTGKSRHLRADWRSKYVVPPPPTDAAVIKAEISELKALATVRKARKAEIEAQREGTVEPFLAAVGCIGRDKKELYKLIDDVQVDAVIAVMHFKLKFSRLRPNKVDPSLTVLFPPPRHPAYPSGHATQAYSSAIILSELAPKLADQVEKIGQRMAFNREIAGVHYRSDTIAGKILALQIAEDYRRSIDIKYYRDLIGRCR